MVRRGMAVFPLMLFLPIAHSHEDGMFVKVGGVLFPLGSWRELIMG